MEELTLISGKQQFHLKFCKIHLLFLPSGASITVRGDPESVLSEECVGDGEITAKQLLLA